MKTFNFSNEQVQLLKEAIDAYSELCIEFPDNKGNEDRVKQMGKLYKLLSSSDYNLNTEEDCFTYPICDY